MESEIKDRKVGIVGDLHLGVRNGSIPFAEFQQNYILEMLDYYHSIGVTSIFQLGDYVDTRRSILGETVHWLVSVFIPKLAEYGITWYQIQGNHSQVRKDSNISTLTWDGWLERESISHGSCCVKSYTTPQDVTINETTFAIVPWVNPSSHDLTVDYLNRTEAEICLGHLELANFLMGSNLAKHGTLGEGLFSKFEATYAGHYHNESSRNSIKYLGTPYDLDWGNVEDCTTRGVYTLDTLTQKLDFIPNREDQTLFQLVEYNYEDIASHKLGKKWLDHEWLETELGLASSVIRVEVTDRSNSAHYKKFVETMRLVKCINYNFLDLTTEVDTVEQEVTKEAWQEDYLGILLNKIESIEGDNYRHDSIRDKLVEINKICTDKNNLLS